MPRTRHYRDLIAWQKAMEVAREVYARTEEFPRTETFGLRMQMRRAAVAVASHIAEGHGKLSDAELHKSLGSARGALYELQTQAELACDLGFIEAEAARKMLEMSVDSAKLINGLLGVLTV